MPTGRSDQRAVRVAFTTLIEREIHAALPFGGSPGGLGRDDKQAVRGDLAALEDDRRRKTYIVIETREGKLVKFGLMLAEERRKFVAGAVRKVLWG